MKIFVSKDPWSTDCGDEEPNFKDDIFYSRLVFNCHTLRKKEKDSKLNYEILKKSEVKISGKVIFKEEFLLIVENEVRFAVVLNNEFRFGNNNLIGNKDIDHSSIEVGDTIELEGYFKFFKVFFCIFTFLENEKSIPDIDYKWKTKEIYIIKESSEPENVHEISDFEKSDEQDYYMVEYEIQSHIPKKYDDLSGFHGFVTTVMWIDSQTWIKNCDGRIVDGVKKGKWEYFDKTGKNNFIFNYEKNERDPKGV